MALDQQRLITAALYNRLHAEAFQQSWAACLKLDGRVHTIEVDVHALSPTPEQAIFSRDMCEALDKELAYNGSWVVQWVKPMPVGNLLCNPPEYSQVNFLWLDEDGDVQFTIEAEHNIITLLSSGKIHWMDQCNQGWEAWKKQMRDVLDPTEGETYKAALGEKPKSQRG